MNGRIDDAFSPTTDEVGMIEKPVDQSVDEFVNWQKKIYKKSKFSVSVVEVKNTDPYGPLSHLLPLTQPIRARFIFFPVNSEWTCYYDNGKSGTDAFPVVSYLAQTLKCRGIKAVAVADSSGGKKGTEVDFIQLSFELFGPEKTDFLNYLRAVSLLREDGKWLFSQSGNLLNGEDASIYKKKNKGDKFTFNQLDHLLRLCSGFNPFSDNKFHLKKIIIIERVDS